MSLTDRTKRLVKEIDSRNLPFETKAVSTEPVDSPKRKLFTLIKGIHEGGVNNNNTYAQFKNLSKRLSQTERLAESNSNSQMKKLAESQTIQTKFAPMNIKPKSRDRNLSKVK